MNRLFLLLLVALVAIACKKDDEEPETPQTQNFAPAVGQGLTALHYDDFNTDAPQMEPGTYEKGARFTQTQLTSVSEGRLVQVQYYMVEKPTTAQLRVYKAGSGSDGPADLVYSENVLPEMQRNSWNVHTLSDSVFIDSETLWITLRYQVSSQEKYLGCDPGPASTNGDWIFEMSEQNWERFVERTGTSINWNIRGVIEPE